MGIEVFKSTRLTDTGFPLHGFTSRGGGVSTGSYASLNLAHDVGDEDANVAENRRRLARTLGVDAPLASVMQVHGAVAVRADAVSTADWTARPTCEADAIVSTGNEVLAVKTADCAAVLLADPRSRVVAAVHAGWRGTAKGIIRKAVRAMGDLGARTADIIAAIGPCIGRDCYEVGEDVARALPESADPIRKKPGKYLLDLPNAVEVSLIIAGIPSLNIEVIGGCTHCETEALFSYRRDGGTTGRMLGFISRRP